MVLKCIHAEYDEVKDRTKLFLEDIDTVNDTVSHFQEVTIGDVTHKTKDELVVIAKQVHREKYYADEVTNQFLEEFNRMKSEANKMAKSLKNYRDLDKRVTEIEQLLAEKFGSKNEHDPNIEVE